MFHFSGYAAALCAETRNSNIEIRNKIKCLGFRISCFGFLCKARLAVVCTAGFPHSEIPGSKVARHLPEAYRSHATSFIALISQGILRPPINYNYLQLAIIIRSFLRYAYENSSTTLGTDRLGIRSLKPAHQEIKNRFYQAGQSLRQKDKLPSAA